MAIPVLCRRIADETNSYSTKTVCFKKPTFQNRPQDGSRLGIAARFRTNNGSVGDPLVGSFTPPLLPLDNRMGEGGSEGISCRGENSSQEVLHQIECRFRDDGQPDDG